jgi:hypothetical protein
MGGVMPAAAPCGNAPAARPADPRCKIMRPAGTPAGFLYFTHYAAPLSDESVF